MASNAYGFDFLRSEHQQEVGIDATCPTASSSSSSAGAAAGAAAAARSDLEAQYDVLQFLNSHRSSGCLPPSIIAKATSVHLDPSSPRYSASVADLLRQNPKVKIEPVPDPENPTLLLPTYGYQAKFSNVTDRTTLLAQMNRCPYGVGLRDLQDSYDGVLRDVAALVTAGEVIAVSNPEDKDRVLFPRGETFLVELDGVVEMGMTERYREALVAANRELQKCRLEAQQKQAQSQKAKDQTEAEAEAEAGKSAAEASEPKLDGKDEEGTGSIKGGTAQMANHPRRVLVVPVVLATMAPTKATKGQVDLRPMRPMHRVMVPMAAAAVLLLVVPVALQLPALLIILVGLVQRSRVPTGSIWPLPRFRKRAVASNGRPGSFRPTSTLCRRSAAGRPSR